MNRISFIAVSIFLLLLPSSSYSISSGSPALERQFQSAVQIWTMDASKATYLCSGVVIAPDTVLTLASCIYADNQVVKANRLFVSTALKMDFNVSPAQAILSVSSTATLAVRHPEADLMLIFLANPLQVEPALLLSTNETAQIPHIKDVILVGYGNQDSINTTTSKPQWPDFWSKDNEPEPGEKIVAKSRVFSVSGKEIQIGKSTTDGTACAGDEGAPIYAHIDTTFINAQRVIGIMTGSPLLLQCGHPSTALRLDAFRDFINEKMEDKCRTGERVWCKIQGLLVPGYDEESIVEKKPSTDPEEPNKTPASSEEQKTEPLKDPAATAEEIKTESPTAPPDNKAEPGTCNDIKNEPVNADSPAPESQTQKTAAPPPVTESKTPETVEPSSPSPPLAPRQPAAQGKPAQPAAKPVAKRRMNVNAEGAGCSCQQVFTGRS